MNGLAILIPIALLLGVSSLFAFFWALGSGQFDDMDGAALRILIDAPLSSEVDNSAEADASLRETT